VEVASQNSKVKSQNHNAEIKSRTETAQADIPPRPQGGKGKGDANNLIRAYYEENKGRILADMAALGLKGMLERWKIANTTWYQKGGLAERWGIMAERRSRQQTDLAIYEKDREAIIHDYQTMKLMDFFAKWHIWSGRWMVLKARWQVIGKVRGVSRKADPVRPQVKPAPSAETIKELTEAEFAAVCVKCEHLDFHNGRMHCKYETCRLGYKLKTGKAGDEKPQPLDMTISPKLQVKNQPAADPPQPEGLRFVVVRVPAETSQPPLPQFDSTWSPLVQMKWLEVYEKVAAAGVSK
jgi:hypothetical protein